MPVRPGSTVALITPMEESTGKIDFPALEKLLQFHVEQGTDNVCVLGTTGEASVLTHDERAQVLKTTVEQVKGKLPILVGCGTIDPQKSKDMTLQAKDLGADASLLVTPYYVKPPQRCLIRSAIDAADLGLPVVLYNVPGRTGVSMDDDSLAVCAQHEHIVGIKEASGYVNRLATMIAKLGDRRKDFLLLSGDDGTTLDFCMAGGDGCISVTANCAPKQMHEMVTAAREGRASDAVKLNRPILSLHNDLFCESNPIPVKWAVFRQGLTNSPYCRPPLDAMAPEFEGKVEAALKKAGLI